MKSQKTNWWLDAALFAGFLVTFLLDVTGIELHQWIGIIVGLFALIHLICHFDWVSKVVSSFFGKAPACAKFNLVLDTGIGIGFSLIIFTGLIISTWLNLTFIDYASWKTIHILVSVLTLFALMLKIALHRKWIVNVAEKYVFNRKSIPAAVPVGFPQQEAVKVNRREFLKVSALLGAGTIVGVSHIHKLLEEVVIEKAAISSTVNSSTVASSAESLKDQTTIAATAQPTVDTIQPTALPTTAAVTNNQSTTACSIRCRKGCSFPGRCGRYADSNGNGKCDLGECI